MQLERILYLADGLRRHWLLFILPIIVAFPIAFLVWKTTPVKYEAKSTILMISANRAPDWAGGLGGFPRQSALEQIAVLEAWLKTDQVLSDLLPQLVDGPLPTDAHQMSAVIAGLRSSLTLQLIGAGVLEIQLQADRAEGLGRKVELIVTRLLEGVLNPEAEILSAPQMVFAHRKEAAIEAERALVRGIEAAGVGPPEQVIVRLKALYDIKHGRSDSGSVQPALDGKPLDRQVTGGSPSGGTGSGDSIANSANALEKARAAISSVDGVVDKLEMLFETYQKMRTTFQLTQEQTRSPSSSYVRVFDSPERLTVIGRPRDPLTGTSPGRKYAIAVMMVGGVIGLAWVLVAVLLDRRLRVAEDFEQVSDLPVVARFAKLR